MQATEADPQNTKHQIKT